MSRSNDAFEKILPERKSSLANCVVWRGGSPAGRKRDQHLFFLFLPTRSQRWECYIHHSRRRLTSCPSGTANSHCESSTVGDAKASVEYAVATPAIPVVVDTNEIKGQSS